jgi:hypothetical protein
VGRRASLPSQRVRVRTKSYSPGFVSGHVFRRANGFELCDEAGFSRTQCGPALSEVEGSDILVRQPIDSALESCAMINGSHVLLYSDSPEADRNFFQDVLNFSAVDAGGGWLIFALPPAELGIHPTEADTDRRQEHGGRRLLGAVLYLMCDDLRATIASLKAKKVSCSAIEEEQWGIHTSIILPSGSEIGLYQPKHPVAYKP